MDASERPRILLTTVFAPYGIDDGYAEAPGMQMELFNNQITREQGIHSPRANFWTFPLYFLAENISVPATVLDFPAWKSFTSELRRGRYTHVGISFIQTNVMKVKRMAEHIRAHHPGLKIILGGYGAALPDLRALVPCDEVCDGEGIRWLRRYFGENPETPIRHPVMNGVARKHLYGFASGNDDTAVIFTGLGCTNRCFFCSTSSKFNGEYVPILATGADLFQMCRRAEEQLGVREFAIIDENFLKETSRAREFLALMERHRKAYHFFVFASAEILTQIGVDFLVRMGVGGVWVGVETSHDVFGKMKGIDAGRLIAGLQDHGITVISSSILFMEHHDRDFLEKDIEWAIGLGSDMHQFMQLTPLPGTPLFAEYMAKGQLIPEFPYTKMSGQNVLNFYHPHFESHEAHDITREAFRRKYRAGGPAVVNMTRTALNGYRRALADREERRRAGLSWNPETLRYDLPGTADDPFMDLRIDMLKRRVEELRPVLPVAWLFAPNARARRACMDVMRGCRHTFGATRPADWLRAGFLSATAAVESARLGLARLRGRSELVRQPQPRRIEYRQQGTPSAAPALNSREQAYA